MKLSPVLPTEITNKQRKNYVRTSKRNTRWNAAEYKAEFDPTTDENVLKQIKLAQDPKKRWFRYGLSKIAGAGGAMIVTRAGQIGMKKCGGALVPFVGVRRPVGNVDWPWFYYTLHITVSEYLQCPCRYRPGSTLAGFANEPLRRVDMQVGIHVEGQDITLGNAVRIRNTGEKTMQQYPWLLKVDPQPAGFEIFSWYTSDAAPMYYDPRPIPDNLPDYPPV